MWNKADLNRGADVARLGGEPPSVLAEVETVAIHAGGAEALRDALRSAIPTMLETHAGEEIATTSARQEALLVEAHDALERAEGGLREERSCDLVACDLVDARRALAQILGRGLDDQVVAAIFSRFCIGK